MGLSGYDQTACLAEDNFLAAEEHSRYQYNRRILSKESKRPIRTNNSKHSANKNHPKAIKLIQKVEYGFKIR